MEPNLVMSYAGTQGQVPFIGNNANPNSATAPGANVAVFQAVYVATPCTVTGVRYVCGTSTGNIDVGLYDAGGTRLASAGSTASPGTGRRTINFSASASISPGFYWLAIVSNSTASFARSSADGIGGYQTFATSFPLPTSVTFPGTASANGTGLIGIVSGGITI